MSATQQAENLMFLFKNKLKKYSISIEYHMKNIPLISHLI